MIIRFIERVTKEKQNTIVKIIGLVLAITTFSFIGQHSFYEYSYDSFHKNSQLIFRTKGTEGKLLGPLAKEQISYVENYARMHPCYRGLTVISGDKGFHETNAYYADGALFDIFSFPILSGDAVKALAHKNQMVISEQYAEKYFGKENPIGKTLLINGAYESNVSYVVAGVFKNIPQNSHLKADLLLSIENVLIHNMYSTDEPWRWSNFFIYFKTSKPLDTKIFSNSLADLATKNGMIKDPEDNEKCAVSALNELHLNGQSNYMDNNKKARDINIRLIIGLIIFLIAWINFIMLEIGNVLKNSSTLNIKRVLGSSSYSIWKEMFQKTIFINTVAFTISILIYLIINSTLQETGIIKPILLSPTLQIAFWFSFLIFLMIGAFITSIAVFLLTFRFKNVGIFSEKLIPVKVNQYPWIALFVIQFGASITIICLALLSHKQVKDLMNVKTGIQTSQILAINSANYANHGDIDHSRSVFEQEVIKINGVEAATSSSYIPGSNIASFMPTRLTWKTEEENVSCRMNFVGYDYIPLFEHKLIAGRNFSKDFPTDSNAIIINKTLATLYGFMNVEEALGKEIYWTFRNENRHIIGVMEDFHHQSAEMPLEQTMFQLWDQARGYCLLKINTSNSRSTIKEVENLWKKVHTGNAFEFFWIDDHYHKQFEKWTEYLMLIRALSIIIILIACVGLFGLSSMLLNKRTKEIGIRRVNGARTTEVMAMLNRDFIKWVAIAFVIACPIAWFAMHKWLENFAYKTEMSWWVFVAAGGIAMLVALLTVSVQSWRAATRNPVESLRYE